MNIVVYCSSREGLDDMYVEAARVVATRIGESGSRLVYGGVNAGMMHTVAQYAAASGAEIEGVVPKCFAHRADSLVTNLITTHDLNDRKARMIADGELFVVLPGGLGTIDELFSTLTHLEINCDTARKIIIANINGVFDSVIAQLYATAQSKFARSANFCDIFVVAHNNDELERILTSHINNYEKK